MRKIRVFKKAFKARKIKVKKGGESLDEKKDNRKLNVGSRWNTCLPETAS
jgi:hypothetical protein